MTIGLTTNYFSFGSGVPSTAPSVATGEYALYQNTANGDLYEWNLSGTPGWTKVFDHLGSGATSAAELGYVESTTPQSGISATVLTDLTSLTLTVTVGTRALLIEGYIPLFDLSAGSGRALLAIVDVTASTAIQTSFHLTDAAGNGSFAYIRARVNPAAGSRTYKLQAKGDGGTATVRAYAAAGQPKSLQIREV